MPFLRNLRKSPGLASGQPGYGWNNPLPRLLVRTSIVQSRYCFPRNVRLVRFIPCYTAYHTQYSQYWYNRILYMPFLCCMKCLCIWPDPRQARVISKKMKNFQILVWQTKKWCYFNYYASETERSWSQSLQKKVLKKFQKRLDKTKSCAKLNLMLLKRSWADLKACEKDKWWKHHSFSV